MRRSTTTMFAVALAAACVACGSDGATSSANSAATSAATSSPSSASAAAGGAEVPTGEQICARVTTASVAADLGLDVTAATPDDTATPQCAYEYVTDDGSRSNVTIAVMRPSDVGGATGTDAFEVVLDVNRSIGGEVDEQEIDAGDGAARLSGASLHLGVVQVGDHVYTLIVPVEDAEVDAVDHLIATMATALR